jgi:hypothetical protein
VTWGCLLFCVGILVFFIPYYVWWWIDVADGGERPGVVDTAGFTLVVVWHALLAAVLAWRLLRPPRPPARDLRE